MTGNSRVTQEQPRSVPPAEFDGMSAGRAWATAAAVLLAILAVGALFTPGEWYDTLVKPTWQPPAWVFGPVWTSLYLLLATGLALLLQAPAGAERTLALRWYFAHLLLNVSWSPLFFGAHSPGWAFVNICIQWLVLLMSILASLRVREWAGWLQLPTLLWVSFALVLNGVIVALNL